MIGWTASGLRDAQGERLAPLLPGKPGDPVADCGHFSTCYTRLPSDSRYARLRIAATSRPATLRATGQHHSRSCGLRPLLDLLHSNTLRPWPRACCGLRPLLDLLHSIKDLKLGRYKLRIAATSRPATLSATSGAPSPWLRIAATSRPATLSYGHQRHRAWLRIAATSRPATLRRARCVTRSCCGLRPLLDLLHSPQHG